MNSAAQMVTTMDLAPARGPRMEGARSFGRYIRRNPSLGGGIFLLVALLLFVVIGHFTVDTSQYRPLSVRPSNTRVTRPSPKHPSEASAIPATANRVLSAPEIAAIGEIVHADIFHRIERRRLLRRFGFAQTFCDLNNSSLYASEHARCGKAAGSISNSRRVPGEHFDPLGNIAHRIQMEFFLDNGASDVVSQNEMPQIGPRHHHSLRSGKAASCA